MKTCVLFPNAFGQPYMEGSAALKSTVPPSFELYLNPQELGRSKRPENGNGHLSLLSGTRRAQGRKYLRLLHVEDSPQLRLLLSVFLKDHFEVVSVSNGLDALYEAENSRYDMICMDIDLGAGMDGFETSKRLRAMQTYQHTPIIALTTLEYPHVREECLQSRINAYIQKPFDKSCLLGTMEELDNKVLKKIRCESHV